MKCIADLHIKDPGSALTHFIAFVGSAAAAAPLLMKAAAEPDASRLQIAALAVFIVSMILLYAASTVYHTLDISEKVNRLLRKLDHMMIFILIAGTYTPICLIVLGNRSGFLLLALVWAIGMGWVCVTAFREIISALPPAAFSWLLAGGIIYTAGGVIYALKLPIFNSRHKNFGSHEIFHLFVMGGSLCHYVVMYAFVA